MNQVFVSLSSYVLGKAMGQVQAVAAMNREVETQEGKLPLAGLETIKRIRDHVEVALLLDSGSSNIAKHRCRQFDAAHLSKCDAWITIDDDVELSPFTVRALLEALEFADPVVVIVPCLIRNSFVVNVEFPKIYATTRLASGALLRGAVRGGFGCVGMNRPALDLIAMHSKRFTDDDAISKPAPFEHVFEQPSGRWLGEDLSFFERLRQVPELRSVLVVALLTGETCHDGQSIQLEVVADA